MEAASTPPKPFDGTIPRPHRNLTDDEQQTLKTLQAEVDRKIAELNAVKARFGLAPRAA